MTISEAKMNIVIDNYFKTECDMNTSIRQAFEKGFRIGVMKGQSAQRTSDVKHGKWIEGKSDGHVRCTVCKKDFDWTSEAQYFDYCPNCGARMDKE